MKIVAKVLGIAGLAMLAGIVAPAQAAAADFNVSAPDMTAYVINAASNPALTLTRGQTYTFAISAAGHPFFIKTVAVTGTGSSFDTGVTGNGTSSGTLTFAVPAIAPNTLFYACQFHSAMAGTINVVSAAVPGAGTNWLVLGAVALLLVGAVVVGPRARRRAR